ncbi:hypothetical protein CL622_01840 [archaeon]|nr:hypothetical protein [archaeon]|tara:strand:- start:742 stop:2043 length:1302 start_codon:yes stop_codon:yes gene_type:complete
MSVTTFLQPNVSSQSPTVHLTAIDDAIAVLAGKAAEFAVHESASTAMSIQVDSGQLFDEINLALTTKNSQTNSFVAPSANPRNDIVYIFRNTAVSSIVTGAEAASPSDPTMVSSAIPLARVRLTVGMTEITNNDIDDLRTSAINPFYMDINGLTEDTAPAVNDFFAMYSTSSASLRKVDPPGFFTTINSLQADTAPSSGDKIVTYDISGSAAKRVPLSDVFKVINGMAQDSSPDTSADFVVSYDTNQSGPKKVLMSDLGGGRCTLISEATIAAATAVEQITGCFDGTYDQYLIEWVGVYPETNDRDIRIRFLSGTTTSIVAEYEYYGWRQESSAAEARDEEQGSPYYIDLTQEGVSSNAANNGCNGTMTVWNPVGTGMLSFFYHTVCTYSGGGPLTYQAEGGENDGTIRTGIEIYAESGNLNGGVFRVWGVKA